MFHTAGNKVTRTYHEGQMAAEEEVLQGGALQTLTRSFLGGRGLEAMTTTESGNTTTAYPLYDTHGNMVATLTKNAAGTSWNVGNLRSYDVWGAVRSGATTGGPSGRYVANLGHVQDDESGLIYMRARYYEPGTGRFVSEDPARDGFNWFVYASNSPTLMLDFNGRTASMSSGTILWLQFLVVGGTAGLLGFGVLAGVMALDPANGVYSAWCCTVAVAAMGIAMSNFTTLVVGDDSNRNALVGSFSSLASQAITIVLATYSAIMTMMIEGMGVAGKSPAGPALAGLFAQTLLQIGALVSMDIDSVQGFW